MDGEGVVAIIAWVLYALLIVQNFMCFWLAAQWRETLGELEKTRYELSEYFNDNPKMREKWIRQQSKRSCARWPEGTLATASLRREKAMAELTPGPWDTGGVEHDISAEREGRRGFGRTSLDMQGLWRVFRRR